MNTTTAAANLLARIQSSAAETPVATPADLQTPVALPLATPPPALPSLPGLPAMSPFDPAPLAPPDPGPLAEVAVLLPRAREKSMVSDRVPPWLRPMFRNQGGFNGVLLETCSRLATVSQHLGQENTRLRGRVVGLTADVASLTAHVGVLTDHAVSLANHLAVQNVRIDALTQTVETLVATGAPDALARLDRLETRVEARENHHAGTLNRLETQADQHAAALARLETQGEHNLSWMQNLQACVDAQTDREGDQAAQHRQIHEDLGRHAEHLRALSLSGSQSAAHSENVDARLDQSGHHLHELQNRLDAHAGHSETVDARLDQIGGHANGLQTLVEQHGQHVRSVHGHLDQLGEHVGRVEGRMDRSADAHDRVHAHADRLGTHLNNLQSHQDRQGERIDAMQRHLEKTTELHERARGELNAATGSQRLLEDASRRLDERQANDASYLRAQLAFHQRLFSQWLAPASGPAAANGHAAETDASAPGETRPQAVALYNDHRMDAFYLAFEDALRGSRHEIKERVRYYVPRVTEARSGGATGPVLDLGCGRGEWLEVLREEGVPASGVDLNTCMVDQCRERGLEVILVNALDHLASLGDASCGAVTAFHLIEHLPFAVLIKFLTECRRVLQPGGVAIFETPNPTNLMVGANSFWYDYTHQRPLPPASTRFLVEHVGFVGVEVVPLHPWNEESFVHGDGTNPSLVERFNDLIYGPQDYAVVARSADHQNRS